MSVGPKKPNPEKSNSDDLTPDDLSPEPLIKPDSPPSPASTDITPDNLPKEPLTKPDSPASPGGDAGFTVGQAAPKPTVALTNPPPIESSSQPAKPIESAAGKDKDEAKAKAGEEGDVKVTDQFTPAKLKEQDNEHMPTGGDGSKEDFFNAAKWGSTALDTSGHNLLESGKQAYKTYESGGGGLAGIKAAVGEMVGASDGLNGAIDKIKGLFGGDKKSGPSTPESSVPAPTSSTGEDAKPAAVDPKKDGPEPSPASDATKGPLASVDKDANAQSNCSSNLEDSMKPHPAPDGAGSTTTAKNKADQENAVKPIVPPADDKKPPLDPTDPNATATKSGPHGP